MINLRGLEFTFRRWGATSVGGVDDVCLVFFVISTYSTSGSAAVTVLLLRFCELEKTMFFYWNNEYSSLTSKSRLELRLIFGIMNIFYDRI